uniref:Mitogen-activated protein kinase n=1 Tax=Oryza nivara TaxID=4536 RepID=A0A0E0HQW2_ORYNI
MQTSNFRKKNAAEVDFFMGYGDVNRYEVLEVIGKGSYGLVCSANDIHTGEKVAIKKIHNIFEHISDAARILREIKLLRLLRHPDIVEIKHIMLPPSKMDFRDIYVVFELMESDLHQVIKANDDLTREHYQFFLYQMLRALKYIHTANVYHRDLKPKNILANANCKLKICDFGLARVAFTDAPTTVFWTDYVATRWYRAPELCGSFYSKVRNDKARKYLTCMRKKQPASFSHKFPKADPLALQLLRKLLAFDPKDHPYFNGLAKVEREPSCQPIPKMEFEFERRRATKEDIKELIFQEILEYHPQLLKEHISGTERPNFHHLSVVDQFRKQFTQVEENLNGSEPSTIVRPAVSSERSLAPTLQWQPNMTHFLNHALCYQNTVFSGSLLDATGPAQAIPRTTPYVDSRSGNLDLYQHHVSREDVQSDTATAQAHAASHGPVPAVSYSLPGTYRIT